MQQTQAQDAQQAQDYTGRLRLESDRQSPIAGVRSPESDRRGRLTSAQSTRSSSAGSDVTAFGCEAPSTYELTLVGSLRWDARPLPSIRPHTPSAQLHDGNGSGEVD